MNADFLIPQFWTIYPRANVDEGPQGYLLRLANANRLTATAILAALNRGRSNKAIASIACELAVKIGGLDPFPMDFQSCLNDGVSIFCPRCLNESPYWRRAWEIKCSIVCTKHKLLLIDRCSRCNGLVRWSRTHLLLCPCGTELRESTTTAAEKNLLIMGGLLNAKLNEKDSLPNWLRELTPAQTLAFLYLVGLSAYNSDVSRRITGRRCGTLEKTRPIAIEFSALIEWPTGFHQLLEKIAQSKGTHAETGRRKDQLGLLRQELKSLLDGDEETAILSELERFIAARRSGQQVAQCSILTPRLRAKKSWISQSYAHKEFGIPPQELRCLVADGAIESKMYSSLAGTQFMMVRASDLIDSPIKLSFRNQAADIGVTTNQLAELLRHAFSEEKSIFRKRITAGILIKRIDAINVKLDMSKHLFAPAEFVEFREIAVPGQRLFPNIAKLVRAAVDGDVELYGRVPTKPGISGWLFKIIDVRRFSPRFKVKNDIQLRITSVAQALGVRQPTAEHWRQQGFLNGTKPSNATYFTVHANEIDRFKEKYIALKFIAFSLRTKSGVVQKKLQSQHIISACPSTFPPGDTLYQKNEQLYCALKNAFELTEYPNIMWNV